ncbi:MAG: ribonucleotide reductase subunit alpha [Rhodocyclaceae bacterium]|nr:ribonucleotide reductase subunit alpha [Rhodocyclaceae bacterium]
MNITHFNDLIAGALAQVEPQRLLLVFASASLPDHPTAEQRARFEAGEAGELAPLMCVAKDPGALADFDALVQEATTLGADWALVFAAALSGQAGLPPSDSQIDAALERMVEAVKSGQLSGLVPFDRSGDAVQLG